MGWLARIFGKEETQTSQITKEDIDSIADALVRLGETLDPAQSNVFHKVNKPFIDVMAAVHELRKVQDDFGVLGQKKDALLGKKSLREVTAQMIKESGALQTAKDKALKTIKVNLTVIDIEIGKIDFQFKDLASKLREILEPLFIKLGKEVQLPQSTIDSAVPKRGWL